jgi:hypothetical protein
MGLIFMKIISLPLMSKVTFFYTPTTLSGFDLIIDIFFFPM